VEKGGEATSGVWEGIHHTLAWGQKGAHTCSVTHSGVGGVVGGAVVSACTICNVYEDACLCELLCLCLGIDMS